MKSNTEKVEAALRRCLRAKAADIAGELNLTPFEVSGALFELRDHGRANFAPTGEWYTTCIQGLAEENFSDAAKCPHCGNIL